LSYKRVLHFFIPPLLLLVFSGAAAAETTVRSGHTASITAITQRTEDNLLVTASQDGSVKVWSTRGGYLASSIQASHLGIPLIAVHPALPRVAIVTTDGINTFRLELWDWETKERIFSKRIEDIPLFLNFSSGGSFITFGKADWNSLTFLDAEKGFEQQMTGSAFGIVSAVYVTPSDKTLITYSPAGMLRYFDLETGELKAAPIRTRSGLEQVQFSPDGLYLVGKAGNDLIVVNLINGSETARQEIKNFHSFSFDSISSNIAVLANPPSGRELSVYRFSRRANRVLLEKRSLPLRIGRFSPQRISFKNEKLYSGDNNGNIALHQLYSGEAVLFAAPRIASVENVSFSDKGMLLSLGSGDLMLIESDLFSEGKKYAGYFKTRKFESPYASGSGSIGMEDGSFLIFSTRESNAPLLRLDTGFGTFTRIGELPNPIIEARRYGDDGNILLLDTQGTVTIFTALGRKLSSQSSFGIRSAAVASEDQSFIAGRSRSGAMPSALLKVDIASGETVPIDSSNILVFMTTYNSLNRTLYTLGYEERRGQLRTVLKSHEGTQFDRETTLLTYPGEDPNASFVAEGSGTRLFTSLGYSGVLMLEWDGFTPMERIEHIPRNLYIHRNFLFSLNRDSSISAWSTENGEAVLTFFLFDDDSWAAVYNDGETFNSPEAAQLLHRRN
jgi:WD40 repeat protein